MTIYSLDGTSPQLPDKDEFWIAPDANVIGDVILGREVSIWFGATLRGDNERITLGEGVNIQDNCVLHTDPGYPTAIGRDSSVGHKAMIHGCTIGEGSLIGMGATILNGTRIGNGCLIGAGALIAEGKTIDDRAVVMGVPGKVVRYLTEDEALALRGTADRYRANFRRFRNGLAAL